MWIFVEMAETVSNVSLGIAKEIVGTYFETVSQKPTLVSDFYGKEGILIWDGRKAEGKMNIYKLLKTIEPFKYQISSLDTQFVYILPELIMLNVSGKIIQARNEGKRFHSTFYIKSIRNASAAIILFHEFKIE